MNILKSKRIVSIVLAGMLLFATGCDKLPAIGKGKDDKPIENQQTTVENTETNQEGEIEQEDITEGIELDTENAITNEVDSSEYSMLPGPIITVTNQDPIKMLGMLKNDQVVITNNQVTSNGSPLETLENSTEDSITKFRIQDMQPLEFSTYKNIPQPVTIDVDFGEYILQVIHPAHVRAEFYPTGMIKSYGAAGQSRIMLKNFDPRGMIPWSETILEHDDSSKLALEVIGEYVMLSGDLNRARLTVPTAEGVKTYVIETNAEDIMLQIDGDGTPKGFRTQDTVVAVPVEEQNESDDVVYSKLTNKNIYQYTTPVTVMLIEDFIQSIGG